MKTSLLSELQSAVEEWAQSNAVETTHVEVKYSGIGSNIHVRVAARSGFENWLRSEREHNLFDFLHAKINRNGDLFISSLITMTEDEHEQYEAVEA